MAELTDRLPGEIIFASYANQIRDRAVMRYVDAAARDASEPLPDTGELAYLTSTGEHQVFDGTAWRTTITDEGGQTIGGALDLEGVLTFGPTDTEQALRFRANWTLKVEVTAGGGVYQNVMQVIGDKAAGTYGAWRFFDETGAQRVLAYDPQVSDLEVSKRLVLRDVTNPGIREFLLDGGLSGNFTDLGHVTFETDVDGARFARLTGYRLSGSTWIGLRVKVWKPNSNAEGQAVDFRPTGTGLDPTSEIRTVFTAPASIENVAEQTLVHASSQYVRNVLIGTTVPDNAWGTNGDLYFRYV